MKYNWFETASPFAKIIISLAFMFCSFFIFIFLSSIIAIPFFQKNITGLFLAMSDISNPANIPLIKYFQVIQSIALFLLPPFFLAIFFGYKPVDYLKLRRPVTFNTVVIAGAIIVISIPCINYLETINAKLQLPEFLKSIENWMKNSEENANTISEKFLRVNTLYGLFFNLFMMAVLPALGEEFVFRGIFQRLFSELFKNYHWGVILSAAFFSAFHLQFYGFVPRMLLGVIFGYMLVWSGSMWIPVIAHFINNAMGVTYYYLNFKGIISDNLDKVGTNEHSIPFTILSPILIILLLYLFYTICKKDKLLSD